MSRSSGICEIRDRHCEDLRWGIARRPKNPLHSVISYITVRFRLNTVIPLFSSADLGPNMNRATSLWLREAVQFVKKVKEAGFEVDFISPKGG